MRRRARPHHVCHAAWESRGVGGSLPGLGLPRGEVAVRAPRDSGSCNVDMSGGGRWQSHR